MDIIKEIAETHPHKVVLSNGKGEYKKIVFARKVLKGRNAYQLEKYTQMMEQVKERLSHLRG